MWQLWSKAETGPICSERKFDLEVFYARAKELVNEYDIRYDPNHIVPLDDTLIDDTFKAGMDLLFDVGILCTDTQRLILLHEDEVKERLKTAKKEITIGEGKDAVTLTERKLEDKRPPILCGGPSGVPLSEEISVGIYMSYAIEPVVEYILPGSCTTVLGMPVKAYAPIEMYAELSSIAWVREATRRAGRPGMAMNGDLQVSSAPCVGASTPEYGYRKTDLRLPRLLPQLKTNYSNLQRVANHIQYGSVIRGIGYALLGAMAGGPETSVITSIAEGLASFVIYQADTLGILTSNALYMGCSGSMSMWSTNLGIAAVNKNTDIPPSYGAYLTYAGPCTEMCLYELAAMTIGAVVVGSNPTAVAPCQGIKTDYCTGTEARFAGEVAHAAAGMKREDANEIIKAILAKYTGRIKEKNPPIGKRFQECYDTTMIIPSKEYVELYRKVRKELVDIGLEFE